jgi:hypothetical protein
VAFASQPIAERPAAHRNFATVAGAGALIGAITGVAVALPLAAPQGWAVFLATAIDIAAGMALMGGLIGANIAGTD